MLVGLFVLVGVTVYVVFSVVLVIVAVVSANRAGLSGFKAGILVFVVMYLLLFWDWIPTRMAAQHYCETEAGFYVYKSLDEWKSENAEVLDELHPNEGAESVDVPGGKRYRLNQRLSYYSTRIRRAFGIVEINRKVVDQVTGEVIAENVDFESGINPRYPESFRDYKLWLGFGSCAEGDKSRWLKNGESFFSFKNKIKRIGGV